MIARARTFLGIVSRFLGRVWLTILYFSVVLPFGVIARLRARGRPGSAVGWSAREERSNDLAEARKQF